MKVLGVLGFVAFLLGCIGYIFGGSVIWILLGLGMIAASLENEKHETHVAMAKLGKLPAWMLEDDE